MPRTNIDLNSILAILTIQNGNPAKPKRISKPESKFVNISILWDYFRFYGPEEKLNDLIHDAFRAHCFHQMLPFDLQVA